jgi:hypothetical protein
MSTATEALIDKIRKLRAKADDPSTTEAEASLFAAKVAELLAQHGLSESHLEVDDPDKSAVVSEVWFGDYLTEAWRRAICNSAARLYFCVGYSQDVGGVGKKKRNHVFVGKPHNVAVARDMSDYLIQTTLRLGRTYRQAGRTRTEHINFMKGCGVRLAERLNELYKAQTASAPQRATNGNPSNLPALYADEATLVAEYLKAHTKLRDMRGHIQVYTNGAAAGRAAGNTVSLSAQVAGSRRSNTMIGGK